MSLLHWVWAWAAGGGAGTPTTPYSGIIVMASASWASPAAATQEWEFAVPTAVAYATPSAAAEDWIV